MSAWLGNSGSGLFYSSLPVNVEWEDVLWMIDTLWGLLSCLFASAAWYCALMEFVCYVGPCLVMYIIAIAKFSSCFLGLDCSVCNHNWPVWICQFSIVVALLIDELRTKIWYTTWGPGSMFKEIFSCTLSVIVLVWWKCRFWCFTTLLMQFWILQTDIPTWTLKMS